MTLLAIDAGNTRVKWAIHDGKAWTAHSFAPTGAVRDQGLQFGLKRSVHPVARIMASNVAGREVAEALTRAAAQLNAPLSIIVSQPAQCGLTNAYRHPAQLGTDRWAALIGARAFVNAPRATLVILAGTALTIDALDAQGRHLGGIIVPGASLMRAALARGTAQLPDEPGMAPPFPASTVEAISRGAADALAGAVERFRQRVQERCGETPLALGMGGAWTSLMPDLPFPVAIHDNLIFEGLRAIAEDTPLTS